MRERFVGNSETFHPCSHLFHLTQLVDPALVHLHAILCQVKVRGVVCQLPLVLRHFLYHLVGVGTKWWKMEERGRFWGMGGDGR